MLQKNLNYFDLNLKWNKSGDAEYPFQTDYNGHKLQVRVNDFPEEPFYTLIVGYKSLCDFDDWPKNWER